MFLSPPKYTYGQSENTPRSYRLLAIILLSVCPFWVLGNSADTDDISQPGSPAIRVTTTLARAEDWSISIPAQGEVQPWEVAILSTKTSGIGATEITVVEGDSVSKGQVLARFDDRLLQAELAQAKANLSLAQANYQLAVANLKRFEHIKVQQGLSEQDLQTASTQVATAAATSEQAQAALTIAQIKLADSMVTAPDGGRILERNIELGQMPQTGTMLFRMLRQGKLEWMGQFDAANLNVVEKDMKVQITDANQQTYIGTVRSISPQLVSHSKLATVRVLLDGSPGIAVNSYVQGQILVGQAKAITVPANCVVIKDGKTWLFGVKDNSANQVLVKLGRRQDDRVEVLSGFSAGDSVVHEGAGFLNNGDRLSIQAQAAASSAGVSR